MSEIQEPQFLYLTTIGRKSGKPHQIEIWFVHHHEGYYLVNEGGQTDWLRNIRATPAVTFCIGTRNTPQIDGIGRVVDEAAEPELAATVRALMNAKYQWGEGTIVELNPKKMRG